MSPSMVAVTERSWMLRYLRNRGDACGQTTCQTHQDILDRRGTFVLGGEDLRVIGIEGERGLALLFLAETVKAFDRRMTMRAILPFAGGAPFELGGLRSVRQRFAGGEQSSTLTPLSTRCSPSATALSSRLSLKGRY